MGVEKLIFKYLQGKLSREEQKELDEWLKDEKNKKTFSRLVDKHRIMIKMERMEEYDWQKSWKQVEYKLHGKRKIYRGYWMVAASLLGIVIFAMWKFTKEEENTSSMFVMQSIEPGRVNAELVLSDGRVMTLNKDSTNLFVSENGNLLENREGVLFSSTDSGNMQKVDYGEIRTPRGGEYQVVLPDGTIVWLNSESKLRFPTIFEGKERKVVASGELYFQVARDSLLPFRVEIEGLYEVEVLGTEFNVRAYPSLPSATTLVKGSVMIRDADQNIQLKPGEQVIKELDGKGMIKREVDVTPCIAWKQGYFLFENERLEIILNELARWYNVNVFFENSSVRDERFSVDTRRHENFEEVLRLIEQTRAVQIEVKGNNVFVK